MVGQVAGRTCILVDDMIDTGATIANAAEILFEQGAARVIVTATHGVLSGPAVDLLKNSAVSEVILTNTLPIQPEKQFDKLTVLSIAPLIARAITEVFSEGSVTSLFDGQSTTRAGRASPRKLAPDPSEPCCICLVALKLADRRLDSSCEFRGFRSPPQGCTCIRRSGTVPEVHIAASCGASSAKARPAHPGRASVPAVLYGHGTEPRHVALPGHDVMLALNANVLISLEGLSGGRARPAQGGAARPDEGTSSTWT